MKVLAFEDTVDIAALLISGKIDMSGIELKQHWNTADHLQHIEDEAPDVLLLDHYIPPTQGLQVLIDLLASDVARPERIVAMSSSRRANEAMMEAGADLEIIKGKLAKLEFWPTHS